ncbi:3-oxoacyl-ACP synthase [Vulcanisaeta thermophila]|uniref:3-oxoacyl-ACP synthase n=1 Tax=Vulcanisaeta thermophila TaxID=867917 RepID=UPI000853CB33|nr:3-oxoacyl-ACP synthase [Vulcanisaeta thermophila]
MAGILSYGIYLPQRRVTASELSKITGIPLEIIVEKYGLRGKSVSEPAEMPSEMALKAAKAALSKANVRIDALIYVGSEFKDYGVWMMSTKLQHELNLKNIFAFDIAAMCTGMIVGLTLAKRMGDLARNILLVAASKESYLVNPELKDTSWMLNFADGASAVVVSHDYNRNRILESSFISDGSFYGAAVVKELGAVSLIEDHSQRPMFVSLMRKDEMKYSLETTSRANFVKVIKDALDKSGYSIKDVDLLILNHMKRSFHEKILNDLGIPKEKSIYLEDYGHVQSSDMVIGLDEGLRRGLIKDGSIVVMASGGTGFIWGAVVLRWG